MEKLIDEIKLPQALRLLSQKQLEQVSAEVRALIIETTSKTGGHVASSLGAVELSVALHATFDSPKDKIIWDVGHQAYAHKILTGRKDGFQTLRQYKGLSGFPNKDESPHDAFTVGHASTSISQALGLAHARDIKGEKNSVIAVIGDGSISGGLSFEGVNNCSTLKSNLIVILNDNEMSISKNVGAISKYLTMIKTSDVFNDLRERIEGIVRRLPQGQPLVQSIRKLMDRTRHIVMSFKVDVIFEELGFTYFGPINGHNIPLLMSTLHHARSVQGPVLIHIFTKKGKGYPPAEADPTKFHGIGPYDIASGREIKQLNPIPSYTQIFGNTINRIALENPNVVAVTAAMLDGTGLEEFSRKFPKRYFDVGIAEEHAVTFSGALARSGLIPITAIYSTFLQRSYDEIMHDVCLQNLPVVFAADRAGIVGEDGATHNGCFDMAYLRTLPNMVIMAPKDENELQHMLFTSTKLESPSALRYPRGSGIGAKLDSELKEMEIGKGEIVYNSPNTHSPFPITIIAIGSMVYPAIEAAKLLEDDNVSATVINARFIKPIDQELIINAAKSSKLIVTVEEGTISGGFGSAVLESLSDYGIAISTLRLGIPDSFIEHGKREIILEKLGLDVQGIYKNILKYAGALK